MIDGVVAKRQWNCSTWRRSDPAEKNNLIKTHAAEAEELERQLRTWQESVLRSLTGGGLSVVPEPANSEAA